MSPSQSQQLRVQTDLRGDIGGRSTQEVDEDAKLQQTGGKQAVCQYDCYIYNTM